MQPRGDKVIPACAIFLINRDSQTAWYMGDAKGESYWTSLLEKAWVFHDWKISDLQTKAAFELRRFNMHDVLDGPSRSVIVALDFVDVNGVYVRQIQKGPRVIDRRFEDLLEHIGDLPS